MLPADDLSLFFGIALSRIQTVAPGQEEFPSLASRFLQLVTESLEVRELKEFHFRLVLGRACASEKEAQELMWPLVAEETKAKLSQGRQFLI